ncbi:hypothetical protein GMORB2_6511 [Geosmithia morbida]|uniref:Zn(2)-C6 fungal-type domain-containing protein n=1 Tax=Geosmithia morbida TaxID=1094350 RepID=A0A9P4YTS3_9HYPO|nr:uncharacterized protein GMORB2_6511 [Geosmithia morbida]KAF4122963.1 hypothetical protein GMORB2_6511 [Geosmithia morbida]
MAPPSKILQSPSPSSAEGAPAGYGRSCTNCSRAKCKCIIRTAGHPCERCERLGKGCQPIAATRKRVPRKNPPSRTAQLEEKLDDLVTILRYSRAPSSQLQPQATGASVPSNVGPSSLPLTSRLDSLATAATATGPHPTSAPPAARCVLEGDGSTSHRGTVSLDQRSDDTYPSPMEAEACLQRFRSWLVNFPFMHLPPDLTAASLREERPFLWLCVMNITSSSIPHTEKMKLKIRRELAEAIVVKHEPRMEILLGLLAYLSWAFMCSSPGWKPFLVLFSQLALSVTYELALTRSSFDEGPFSMTFKIPGPRPKHAKLCTAEERRALVAVWFLTSAIATFLGRIDPFRWNPHMDECLEALELEKETPDDETLVALVRLQLVSYEAHMHIVDDAASHAERTPSYVYRKGLLIQLNKVREGISSRAAANSSVQAHSYATEMTIHSTGLFSAKVPQTLRIDAMYSCLQACRRWLDIWFSIPHQEVPGMTLVFYVQLMHTQKILYFLHTTDEPAWDKEIARGTADILEVLDRTIQRLVEMQEAYPLHGGGDNDWGLYAKAAKMIRSIKATWEPAVLQASGRANHLSVSNQNPDQNRNPNPNIYRPTSMQMPSNGSDHTGTSGRDSAMMMSGMGAPIGGGPHLAVHNAAAAAAAAAEFSDPTIMDFTDFSWMVEGCIPWDS